MPTAYLRPGLKQSAVSKVFRLYSDSSNTSIGDDNSTHNDHSKNSNNDSSNADAVERFQDSTLWVLSVA